MAWELTLTDGLNSIELHPADRSTMFVLGRNIQLFSGETYTDYHEARDGTRQLLNVRPGDHVAQFLISVPGTRQDGYNTLTRLRRWIKGPDQQAIRAEMSENALPVYLLVQPDGVSNATRWRVRSGNIVEADGLVHPAVAKPSSGYAGHALGIELALYPTGEAAELIELNNVVVNGHFERAGTDKIPYGWTGGANITIERTSERALIGQYSALIENTLNLQSVVGDSATVPENHLMVMTCWLSGLEGTWDLQLQTGAGTALVSVTDLTAANIANHAVDSRVDRAGNVWYLLKLEQVSLNATTTVRPAIRSNTGNTAGSVYVDGVSIMTVAAINIIPNPAMDMPGAAGGSLVAGWSIDVTSGGGTGVTGFTIDTDDYFIAPASQEVTVDATSPAWRYWSLTFDENRQDEFYTLRFWLKVDTTSGTSAFKVCLRDRNGTLVNSIDNISTSTVAGLALASKTGGDSATWYQMELTGTNDKGPGIYISFEEYATNASGNIRFHVDEVYLYRGTGPVFRGVQMFGRFVYNRNDWDGSNPHRVNTVDFYNIPGDVDAKLVLDWYLTKASITSGQRAMLSKQVEERWPAVRIDREAEAAGGWWQAGTGSGTWSDANDTGASAGVYRLLSSTGAGTNYLAMSVRANETAAFYSVPRRVLARVRASSLSTTFQLKYKVSAGSVTTTNEAVSVQVVDTYEIIDLGEINVYVTPGADGYWFTVGNNIELHVTTPSSIHTTRIDTVYFFPSEAGSFVQAIAGQFVATSEWIRFDGEAGEVYRASEGVPLPYTGSLVTTLAHGQRMTRLAFLWAELDGEHIIATASTSALVRAKIRPRTTMLLGTV